MSLFIKDVEMPDSCLNCRFRTTMLKNVLSPTMRTSVYVCLINGMEINNWYEAKHKDCPLVEVPTPHGRLIDADRLMEVIEKNSYLLKGYYNSLENGMFLTGIKQAIDESPTIIEAEVE